MAWALDLYGFEVWLVENGYKSYRRWVLSQFGRDYPLGVIGGMTGSGKTRILHVLGSQGEQVIDLEDLAQHQGSAYGSLNRKMQPSQEQFENNLAEQLYQLDRSRRIWVEDEGVMIGKCQIPQPFWSRMQEAFLFDLQVPSEERVQALVEEYGSLDKDFLVECTERIRKRLGTEQTKYALAAIREGRMADFIRQVLVYYDKTYRKALDNRPVDRLSAVPVTDTDPVRNARQILTIARGPAAIGDKTF